MYVCMSEGNNNKFLRIKCVRKKLTYKINAESFIIIQFY